MPLSEDHVLSIYAKAAKAAASAKPPTTEAFM